MADFKKDFANHINVIGTNPYLFIGSGLSRRYLKVKLADGTEIDFDARGEWTDVERPGGVVPDGLIPQPILKFVAANYPGRHVRGVERDGRNHEITLDNGLELKFNRRFRLVETDH